MEAKEFLSRAWNIETQVQSRLEQIERLRSLACRVTAGFGGAGGPRSRNVTAMQDTIVQITEAEEKLAVIYSLLDINPTPIGKVKSMVYPKPPPKNPPPDDQ